MQDRLNDALQIRKQLSLMGLFVDEQNNTKFTAVCNDFVKDGVSATVKLKVHDGPIDIVAILSARHKGKSGVILEK
jgi:hypothetical protein